MENLSELHFSSFEPAGSTGCSRLMALPRFASSLDLIFHFSGTVVVDGFFWADVLRWACLF